MKNFFRSIHLYLGLAAGLVIMLTCITGAALVFEKELQHSIYPERYYVESSAAKLPLDTLASTVMTAIPGAKITGIKVYAEPNRSAEVSYSEKGKEQNGQAFVNPYTGELISLYSYRNTFFYTIFALHRWLLAGDTGKMIVGVSTVIFLFILITGIVLWWPKKKKLKQRLKLKFDGGWKRINHDLHIVIGFYSAIFLFAFAFTGLAWSFKWFNDGIYWVTGTENKRPDPPTSTFIADAKTISWESAYKRVASQVANVQYYNLNAPKDSVGAISISTLSVTPVHEKASDQYFLDQYTGSMIGKALYADRNLGQRVRSLFYPIHVGSIGGLPGRIIAFLVCVAGFTFPVTGVILWLNRLKKEKKKVLKKSSTGSQREDQKTSSQSAVTYRN